MDATPRIIKIGDALSQLINVALLPGINALQEYRYLYYQPSLSASGLRAFFYRTHHDHT